MTGLAKRYIKNFCEAAGIQVNGSRPWDVIVHNPAVYARILANGSLGTGESYMEGWWDCERLDEMMHRLLYKHGGYRGYNERSLPQWFGWIRARLFDLQQAGSRSSFARRMGPVRTAHR